MLDVGRLRALLAISEHGGVPAAARALAVPAADVHAQLTGLEQSLGAPLVDGDRLTPAGRRVAASASAALSALEEVGAAASAVEGSLRLGVEAAAGRALLPSTLASLGSTGLSVEISPVGDGLGSHDVAVVAAYSASVPRRPDPALERRELLTEPLLLAVSSSHGLAGRSSGVRLAELSDEAWVVGDGDGVLALERAAASAGFEPVVVARAAEDALALTLVAAGHGIALLPASAVPAPVDGVRFLPLVDAGLRRTVTALVRRSAAADPSVRRVLDALGQAARRVAAAVPGVTARSEAPAAGGTNGVAANGSHAGSNGARRADPLTDPLPAAEPPAAWNGTGPATDTPSPFATGSDRSGDPPSPFAAGSGRPTRSRSADPAPPAGPDLPSRQDGDLPAPFAAGSDQSRSGNAPSPFAAGPDLPSRSRDRSGDRSGDLPAPFAAGPDQPTRSGDAPSPFAAGPDLRSRSRERSGDLPAPFAAGPELPSRSRERSGELPAPFAAEPGRPAPSSPSLFTTGSGPANDPPSPFASGGDGPERPSHRSRERSGDLPPADARPHLPTRAGDVPAQPGPAEERPSRRSDPWADRRRAPTDPWANQSGPPRPRQGEPTPPPEHSVPYPTASDLGVRSLTSAELSGRRGNGAPAEARPNGTSLPRRGLPARAEAGLDTLPPAPAGADDVRLSIFEELQSEWFTHREEPGTPADRAPWDSPADDGWRAAARLAEPTTAGTTTAGLPRRKPQALYVPGTATNGEAQQSTAVTRSATEVRGRLSSYRDGVRRGRHAEIPRDEN